MKTKNCTICREQKKASRSQFRRKYIEGKRTKFLSDECSDCLKSLKLKTEQECSRCESILPLDEFRKKIIKNKNYYSKCCKKCTHKKKSDNVKILIPLTNTGRYCDCQTFNKTNHYGKMVEVEVCGIFCVHCGNYTVTKNTPINSERSSYLHKKKQQDSVYLETYSIHLPKN